MRRLQFCLVVFALLALSSLVFAQVQNGQFSGTVLDPSGAAISGAKITIVNQGTGLSTTATTNSSGNYTVSQLPVGTYKLSAEAPGFKTLSNANVELNAGTTAHVDFKLSLGKASEVVEVTGAAATVNTEDAKLAQTVSAAQVANLPLNGRNVYDLIQMAPGAVNVNGVDFENGHGTVVNGLREDFNGFLVNGLSNKGLSGGVVNVPIQDTVEEFQQLTLNNSAQYGSSAGSVTNLVTKQGSNAWHGSGWDFIRNDKLDANEFLLNQNGVAKPKLRFNQFGGTLGGPIVKDKLFFFLSYQQDHFTSVAEPQSIQIESPQFAQAVIAAEPNTVAQLLYHDFPSPAPVTGCSTINPGDATADGNAWAAANGVTLPSWVSSRLSALDAQLAITGPIPFECSSVAVFGTQVQTIGNLFQGKEASGRIDYQPSQKNRFFVQYNWLRESDTFGPCSAPCTRGFTNPTRNIFPTGQAVWDSTITPSVVNEARVGYTQNNTGVATALGGVPAVYFDDGTTGFGSYSGYPQFFKEHIYSYSDMVSISHGNHNIKVGVDLKRNIENSEFNIARPSYEFSDPIFFAADAPYAVTAGTDPGFVSGTNAAQLYDNYRHWRNLEFGTYFQDDWKVSRRLTLNLGIRYDLFTRHHELNGKVTQFILGPATSFAGGDVLTGNVGLAAGLQSANNPANCPFPNDNRAVLAGECGPGGFAAARQLGSGDHNNFGPRVGFAWDVFGNAKTSLRGGFGISYESTLYNPLSNSRWNPPYYSFASAVDQALAAGGSNVIYGPMTCTGSLTDVPAGQCSPSGVAPTYLGPPTNIAQGPAGQSQAIGNIDGWYPGNPDFAYLTGIVPQTIRDPYVYNWYLSVQHEIMPKLTVEADYVATAGHKLFRADNINRLPGSRLPSGSCVQSNLGETLCHYPGHVINENYGVMRQWENQANSNYNSFQLAIKKQTSHGLMFNVNYTWSHSLDDGSTWHSGATTANGAAAGDAYTTDWMHPKLDYGNSIYDIRQRLVLNYVWELPFGKHHGFLGAVANGWQYNGIFSAQTGPHWSPYNRSSAKLLSTVRTVTNPDGSVSPAPCDAGDVSGGTCLNHGGDYLLSSTGFSSTDRNSRPNSTIAQYNGATHAMWANGFGESFISNTFSAPCLACYGNLGRNQFVGPGQWDADMSLFKNFKVTERVGLQFRAEGFNVFNHTNFLLASTASGTSGPHNRIDQGGLFGKAGATLNARNLQFGAKITF
jgi:hypothetical protein